MFCLDSRGLSCKMMHKLIVVSLNIHQSQRFNEQSQVWPQSRASVLLELVVGSRNLVLIDHIFFVFLSLKKQFFIWRLLHIDICMTVSHEHLNYPRKVESGTSSNLLQIHWLDGGSLLIGRPAGHAFIGREQSNELYKTELKMNCRLQIFIWEDNINIYGLCCPCLW